MTDAMPPALFAFFERLPRQGPGSDALTLRLFDRLAPLLPERPVAADMGCGSGASALVLAAAGARVTGVDVHPPFLAALERGAAARGLGDRVSTRCASMLESGIAPGSLDLVWSEGAAYTVGFETALAGFARLLKPGGAAMVSECVWLARSAADEATRAFWADGYPEMGTASEALAAAERQGFALVAAETLPPADWEEGFLAPMEAAIEALAADPPPGMGAVLEEQRRELALFREHREGYGYLCLALVRARDPAPA